jgi:type IV pilus biogenesis protein PilP
MFGTRFIGTVITILIVLCCYTAFAADTSFTIRDLEMKQRELIKAKMQAELDRLQGEQKQEGYTPTGSNPALSAPVGNMVTNNNQIDKEKDKRIVLIAVYGVDQNLTADLLLNGTVVSANRNDVVNGWKVKMIQPSQIVMTKGGETKTFTVSVDTDPQQQEQPKTASPFPPGNMVDPGFSNYVPQTPNPVMR